MTLKEENEVLKKACEMLIELARDYASGCTMYGDSSSPNTIEEVEDMLGEKLLKQLMFSIKSNVHIILKW